MGKIIADIFWKIKVFGLRVKVKIPVLSMGYVVDLLISNLNPYP